MTSIVVVTYAFYFQWPSSVTSLALSLKFVSVVAAIVVFVFWMLKIASLQNVAIVRVDVMTIEEFTCLVYYLATILYAVSAPIWNLCSSDWRWQSRHESSLIFYMAVHFLYTVIITGMWTSLCVYLIKLSNITSIVIPGRIVRMLAVNNMKSLNLKQVFVRHVSHEIRYYYHLHEATYYCYFFVCSSVPR